MLKLMNALLILVILFKGIQSIVGEALQCQFKDVHYFGIGSLYSCVVTALENPNDDKIITGYNSVHQPNKNDRDVKQIYIHDKNTKYIPAGLGSLFNLTALIINDSELIEIRSKDFQGMQNLEYLSLRNNKLTSVPSSAFFSLTKLEYISLSSNQIKYIGSGAFDQLKNLKNVYLHGNICVNKEYNGATAITQMKEDIKLNCVDPISTSTTTTTTSTTTQNPMEVELEALKIELAEASEELQKGKSENLKVKNERDALMTEKGALVMELSNKTSEIIELKTNCKQPIEAVEALDDLKMMMIQLLKESKVHQMECQNIIKLRAEISLAKNQQKKESSEAKETMKHTINDLNKELMELKNQRQLERNTYMGLRTKLMEAKEQLTTCEINERSLM